MQGSKMAELENKIKKQNQDQENFKNQYLKKNLSKNNNFELSQLVDKRASKFVKEKEFSKEEMLKEKGELFVRKLTERFAEMFQLCLGVFGDF